MSAEKKIITGVSIAVCFILVFIYCFAPLCVGINNGGSNRETEIMSGLIGINDGNFFVKYTIEDSDNNYYTNSYSTFVKSIASVVKNFTSVFDARIIAFIYLVFLLISVFYLNKYIDLGNLTSNIILAAAIVFIFFDLSYLLYLNCLYAESAFIVFFVLALSLYIKLICSTKPQLPTTIFFIIVSIIICGLKPGMYMLAYPFAAMAAYLLIKRKGYAYRVAVVFLIILLLIYPPLRYKNFADVENNKFNSVFYGVLYEKDDAAPILNKLGIDEKYISLAGKNTYEQLPEIVNYAQFKNDVYNKISAGKLLGYYMTNPSEYISQFKYVGFNAFESYPKYAGNYTLQSGKAFDAKVSGFKLYNLLKEKVFPKTLWFIYLIPFVLILLLLGYRKKIANNGIIVMGIALAISSLILFNIPMLTGGLVDISRTMAIFNIAFDSVIFMLLCIFIYVTNKRKQEFKENYGLSQ